MDPLRVGRWHSLLHQPGSHRTLLLVALAMSLVITVAACDATGSGDDTATGDESPTSAGSVSPPTTAAASPDDASPTTDAEKAPTRTLTWRRVEHDESLEGGFLHAVTGYGSGLVAGGGDSSGHLGRTGPAVWISSDGRQWSRVESQAFDAPSEDSTGAILDVAAGEFGVVAAGQAGTHGTELDAAIWMSPDGQEWERVGDPEVLGGHGEQHIRSIGQFGEGFVAVGFDNGFPAAWFSEDGVDWERAEGLGPQPGVITGVEALPGVVVAVGYSGEDPFDDEIVPAIWVTADGRSWQPLTETTDAEIPRTDTQGSGLVAITPVDNEVLVLGYRGSDGFVWSSSDGIVWEEVVDPLPRVTGGPVYLSIHGDASGMVVTGAAIISTIQPHHGTAFIWSSEDGESWVVYDESLIMRTPMLDSSPPGGVADVAAMGDMLVGVGHVGIYGDPGEIDSPEFCGGGGSEAPSCRTDVAVWIGVWSDD